MLSSDTNEIYISSMEPLGRQGMQMCFLVKLPQTVIADKTTMTHLCLVCDMSSFDALFDKAEQSDPGVAFVIRPSGFPIYKDHRQQSSLTSAYNVLSALEQASYRFDASYESMVHEIVELRESNCIVVDYDGETQFVGYCPLDIEDWSVLLVIPEQYVGESTALFTRTVATFIVLLAVAVFVAMLITVLLSLMRYHRQRAEHIELQATAQAEHNANLAKTRFLSSMSHDIRTPMNAIVGMTNVAERYLDDPVRTKECLDKISLASNHLLALINDILDISHVESGKMVLRPVAFSLVDSMTNLVNIVRQQLITKNIEFEVHLYDLTEEYIYADELRINQVFINLLTNAVKYTPMGGSITLELKEAPIPDKEGHIRLVYVVSDTGIGMSPEFQATMYENFSRATDNRVDKIHGTGLGLPICKQLTELMGGRIECESEVNAGTTFTVTLDVELPRSTAEELRLPAIKVLVIDDDPLLLSSAKKTLEEMGAEADAVNDREFFENTSEYLGKNDYRVVIANWKMPENASAERFRHIKAALGDKAPILLASSYDWIDGEGKAASVGADGFIHKPFFRSTIYRALNDVLHFDKPQNEEDRFSELEGMKLLVAEDNDLNWEIIEEMLGLYGISAVRAENGKECVERMQQANEGDYALILMDIQMPIMSGLDATRHIRASTREWEREIPIIAMTADAFAEDVQNCLAAGMDKHIAKPVDIQKLLLALREVKQKGKHVAR